MIRFKVKQVLADRHMVQRELWENAGIRKPTVWLLCSGKLKMIPVELLNKACSYLNCQPGDLFEYIPDEEQQE